MELVAVYSIQFEVGLHEVYTLDEGLSDVSCHCFAIGWIKPCYFPASVFLSAFISVTGLKVDLILEAAALQRFVVCRCCLVK